MQRLPTADPGAPEEDRQRYDEMAGLRGELARSIAALEAEVGRLREVVATAAEPVEVEIAPPAPLDWDLPPLDPAWLQELDALLDETAPTLEPDVAARPAPATAPAAETVPPFVDPFPGLFDLPVPDAPTRRRRLRLRRPTLPATLFAVGALAAADCVVTIAWQEPITALYGDWQQTRLAGQLEELDRTLADSDVALDPAEVQRLRRASIREGRRARMAAAAARLDRRAKPGKPLGRLRIAKLGASMVVVHGTGSTELRTGPGRYEGTALPGTPGGVVGIAGHRTSWSAPFRKIDRLRKGDKITMTMPYGKFTYAVTTKRIVTPDDVWVLKNRNRSRIVLTACHPLFSAAKRIVVTAELRSAEARGAARRLS